MCRLIFWRAAGAGAAVILLTTGCSHLSGASRAAAQAGHSYVESLRICRFWRGGPVDQKLPATHPVIAGCLSRLGWSSDGLPVDLPRDPE
jgi:hypothetical protein